MEMAITKVYLGDVLTKAEWDQMWEIYRLVVYIEVTIIPKVTSMLANKKDNTFCHPRPSKSM